MLEQKIQAECLPGPPAPGYRGMKGGNHRGRKEWMLCFIRVFPRVFHKCVFVCVIEIQTERDKKKPSNFEEATIFELASLCVLECPQGFGRRPGMMLYLFQQIHIFIMFS